MLVFVILRVISLSLVTGTLSACSRRVVSQTACIGIRRLARILKLLGLLEGLGNHLPRQSCLHLPTAMPSSYMHLLEKFPARLSLLLTVFISICI